MYLFIETSVPDSEVKDWELVGSLSVDITKRYQKTPKDSKLHTQK